VVDVDINLAKKVVVIKRGWRVFKLIRRDELYKDKIAFTMK
jgi:hypothetical protein